MPTNKIPQPQWIDLRSPQGKLLGRFDIQRGLLEIKRRGQAHRFDLSALSSNAPSPPHPPPQPKKSLSQQ